MNDGTCRICNTSNNQFFIAKEMMFGTHEPFKYFQCAKCRTIQISKIPDNLAAYYPKNYNAYEKIVQLDNPIKKVIKKFLTNAYLTNKKNFLSNYLLNKFGVGYAKNMKYANVCFNSKILDVGCGIGHRLLGLSNYGFKNLTGIEPFIETDILYKNGVTIRKQTVFEHEGNYDFIMLNHVFEHVRDPYKVFEKLTKLLNKDGIIHLSMPVADSFAWKKYHINWVALDPPRHLHIFTESGLNQLVNTFDFKVTGVIHDSSAYQFWGSEQYLNNIPLRSPRSYYENKNESIFDARIIEQYSKRAIELNRKGEGDTACFIIKSNS